MKKKYHPMKWVIWALAAVFYFYEFFIRVAPSVMVPELMSAFSVNATAIGTLSAFYFYIYGPMQIPVGILTDRFGARKLLAIASFVAGLGGLLFAFADHYWLAAIGRLLMGAGSSFGFIGMVYICSHWFVESKRGILIGLANSIGMIGAVMGEGPLRIGINLFGWRISLFSLAIFGFFLSAIIFLLVRNSPKEMEKYDKKTKKPQENVWKNLVTICKNSQSWLNAIMSLFLYVSTPAFAGLWGIPFLHATYGISIELAGFAISMIFIGWAIGGPIIGRFSDKIQAKKPILIFASLLAAILMSIIIYVPHLPIPLLFVLLALLGCIFSAQLLNYSYAMDINPSFAKGTAAAFTNFIIIMGSALMQPFIGFLLDANWTGQMEGGIRLYSNEAYQIAMSCFPISLFIAFFLGLLLLHRHKPQKAR